LPIATCTAVSIGKVFSAFIIEKQEINLRYFAGKKTRSGNH
jgi:hypothetical protein